MDDRPLDTDDAVRARLHRDIEAIRVTAYAQFRDAALQRTRPRPSILHVTGAVAGSLAAVLLALLAGVVLGDGRRMAAAPSEQAPAGGAVPVCVSAQQRILGMTGMVNRADRIEAKRMPATEFIAGSGGQLPIDIGGRVQGNTQLCVVAVAGELRQPGQIERPPRHWGVFVAIAGSDEPLGSQMGADGTWPAYFDALPDRRPNLLPGHVVDLIGLQSVRVKLESAMLSAEFGNPVLLQADTFTELTPRATSIAASGVKPGDRVGVFFEREGRDPLSGAYRLSVFRIAAAAPSSSETLFLPRCPSSSRPQQELDHAGLPPLVPGGPLLRCLMLASAGGSAYESGYSAAIELTDGRQLSLYERRNARPEKAGPSQVIREGARDVAGAGWTWSVLANGVTTLSALTRGSYVELALPGDESQVDTLAAIAGSLQPVESLPRPVAREICSSLRVSASPIAVAAAFDSTAAAIARWDETQAPGGSLVTVSEWSEWRRHAPNEPVTLCYLDGDFGPPRGPASLPGASLMAWPNYDRVVYLVGVERRPLGRIFGWKDRIAIRDPGR